MLVGGGLCLKVCYRFLSSSIGTKSPPHPPTPTHTQGEDGNWRLSTSPEWLESEGWRWRFLEGHPVILPPTNQRRVTHLQPSPQMSLLSKLLPWAHLVFWAGATLFNLYGPEINKPFSAPEFNISICVASLSIGASLVAQTVKNLLATQDIWVWSLGWEEPLEKGMVTHSSILAWRIPWTEEPAGLQFLRSQTVRHDWATNT